MSLKDDLWREERFDYPPPVEKFTLGQEHVAAALYHCFQTGDDKDLYYTLKLILIYIDNDNAPVRGETP